MELLSLPVLMIENILSFLPFDEIARARMVCKDLDHVCQRMLNRGFIMIERRHALSLKSVKARLPRRESERRMHHLSRHCDILSAIETRISMLNMTYSKFIEHKICCFIPGKVIDEIKRVLDIVQRNETPPRAHEVLQELRDISSMAIEHFDDKISPALRKRLQQGAAASAALAGAALAERQMEGHAYHVGMEMEGHPSPLWVLQRRSMNNARVAIMLCRQYNAMAKKMLMYKKMALRGRRTVRALTARASEQGAAIAELRKRIDECDIKYSELTHTNQAGGGKAIAAPPGAEAPLPAAGGGQPLRNFASQIKLDLSHLPIGTGKRNHGKATPNIKPRKPVIRLPSISEEDPDEPRAKQAKLEPAVGDQHAPGPSASRKHSLRSKASVADRLKRLQKSLSKDMSVSKAKGNVPMVPKKTLASLDRSWM